MDCSVTFVALWCSQGWSVTDAVFEAISMDTRKVVDVVHMSSSCAECKKMEQPKMEGEVSWLEYLSWFTKHKPNCYLIHEGSSTVSKFMFSLLLKTEAKEIFQLLKALPFLKQYRKEIEPFSLWKPFTSMGSLTLFALSLLPDIPNLFSWHQYSKV